MKRMTQRDPFAFSLRGMTVVATAVAPIVVSDRAFRKPDCRTDVEVTPRATQGSIEFPPENAAIVS